MKLFKKAKTSANSAIIEKLSNVELTKVNGGTGSGDNTKTVKAAGTIVDDLNGLIR